MPARADTSSIDVGTEAETAVPHRDARLDDQQPHLAIQPLDGESAGPSVRSGTIANKTPTFTWNGRDRDGVVCAEGSGILLLESLDSALGRDAEILAELIGFASTSDPESIANPNAANIAHCMRQALLDAGIGPADIDYVNAHATGTELGDIAESEAICSIFGDRVPVSSIKGNLGHAMAASGAIELEASVEMLRRGILLPTHNLDHVDPLCASVTHVRVVTRRRVDTVMKNNFALGGVNSSLIIRRFQQ